MISTLTFDEKRIRELLFKTWSLETSTRWTAENPACGQCSVTALVIHKLFGGLLLKTRVDGAWHFYNKIGNQIFDLTDSQFPCPVVYEHIPAKREEAFQDTSVIQYQMLKQKLNDLNTGN